MSDVLPKNPQASDSSEEPKEPNTPQVALPTTVDPTVSPQSSPTADSAEISKDSVAEAKGDREANWRNGSGWRITEEAYKKLLDCYRQFPKNHRRAAASANVSHMTAKRAWHRGWNYEWARPIKDVLSDEAIILRAAVYEREAEELGSKRARELLDAALTEAARIKTEASTAGIKHIEAAELEAKKKLADILSKAKVDAAQSMADRAQAIVAGRKGALAAVALPVMIIGDVKTFGGMIKDAMMKGGFKTPNQALHAAMLFTKIVEASERALHNFIQVENLNAGRPTEILGIETDEANPDEVEKKLRVVQRALARRKAILAQPETAPDGTVNGSGSSNNDPAVH